MIGQIVMIQTQKLNYIYIYIERERESCVGHLLYHKSEKTLIGLQKSCHDFFPKIFFFFF